MTEMVVATGGTPWLTLILLLPLLGVVATLLAHEALSRQIALATSVITLVASLPLWFAFDNTAMPVCNSLKNIYGLIRLLFITP